MISVNEAKKIVLEHAKALLPVRLLLLRAAGMVLAEDVYAAVNIPAFDQSSMDGYAISFSDFKNNKPFKIQGEMAAGSNEIVSLLRGNAIRIFTGAIVPYGADTVVMQEKTRVENIYLIVEDENILQGSYIRNKGSEIKAGELALAKDSLLTAAAVGFLAGVGIADVFVYAYPLVSIIITGNELQMPGQPLMHGQVYDSNSFSLQAALKQLYISEIKVYRVKDELEKVKQILHEALQQSDVVFLTGGVSVGDYDFVVNAAEANGIEQLFHKIKQRPGKPIYFGKKVNKLVFGLPGNPASMLTCFYEYVEPALKKISGKKTGMQVMQVPLAEPFKKSAGLTHYLKGYYNGETVTALHAQESYRLRSFANANCLIKLEEDVTTCEKDELVEIHVLPY
jgi:molybdopterin molybdotransferase